MKFTIQTSYRQNRDRPLDAAQKMCEVPGGHTLIYVTHHIEEMIPAFTHALALRRGKAVACGSKKEVLTGRCCPGPLA